MSSSITLSYEKFMLVKRAIVDSLSEDPPVDNIQLLEDALDILNQAHLDSRKKEDDSYINNWVKNNIS
jgi:hypothetical protein|tara:strand:+ start:1087 stop:1290 length:204 start_codon:yes stop_codon:yes gene_type:complete